MGAPLSRMLQPSTIAVIGGGSWCEQVILQARKSGFQGRIFPVHPKAKEICGETVFANLGDLPTAPDASFIGVNRFATIETVKILSEMGAGGAVCFASGFSEAATEDSTATDLQEQLVQAAKGMPILGPNCYGFINALDGVALWPDQHGCTCVEKGVAILTQSSNIAINLTMQQRALPVAYMVTCGNMAQTSQAAIALALLDDPRVTAIGFHIEGFTDLPVWFELAQKAHARNIPLIALKVGKSAEARKATISHTASLAGSDAGAEALLKRLGIARVDDLCVFLETLKLLHFIGRLPSNRIASISCSGGEASLIADHAASRKLVFPALNDIQRKSLGAALGPMVALANPLDYHTYIWLDTDAMTAAWSAMPDPNIALTIIILDYPHTDPSDWKCATAAAIAAKNNTNTNIAVVASLPESLPHNIAHELAEAGIVPMHGLSDAIAACEVAANMPVYDPVIAQAAGGDRTGVVLTESQAKLALQAFGLDIPNSITVSKAHAPKAAEALAAPLVVKSVGIAHKTETGGVIVDVEHVDLRNVVSAMQTNTILVEEMITGGVAEIIIGITRDGAHGFVLTIGAGGIFAEIVRDTVSLMLPASDTSISEALAHLKTYPILKGYRGKPAASMEAIVTAINSLQSYVLANVDRVEEVEVNPLICTPTRAIAVDALIKEVPE